MLSVCWLSLSCHCIDGSLVFSRILWAKAYITPSAYSFWLAVSYLVCMWEVSMQDAVILAVPRSQDLHPVFQYKLFFHAYLPLW